MSHYIAAHLTDCGDCGDDLAKLEFVEDGGLAGGVEPNHQDAHLLLAEEAFEERREHVSHCGVGGRSQNYQPERQKEP